MAYSCTSNKRTKNYFISSILSQLVENGVSLYIDERIYKEQKVRLNATG